MPTLLLLGDADQNASYDDSLAAARRIPTAKFITFERGAHTIIVSRAREMNEHLVRFVAEAVRPAEQ